MKLLEGKNAIITGSNRGIGKSIVNKFAQNGANIWACAREKNAEFEEFCLKTASEYNVLIKPVYFDLRQENDIKRGIKQILSEKTDIDILVNNAGVPCRGLMSMTAVSQIREVFEVNFFAQITIIQMVSKKMMRQKSGCITNIASGGGIEANPGYLGYGSSKAAVIYATRTMAKELSEYNIRVNAVAPGLTNTDMAAFKTEKEIAETIENTPIKRMAETEEIADAVLFISSGSASFITGHILVVDGGRVA